MFTPPPSAPGPRRERLRRPAPRFRAFALLITIVLVAFLVLILVGLASLTRVETRVAGNTQSNAQARQNALFSLNVALGELQRLAGPDRRVTATADLGDGSNGIPAPNTGARHWTGVWGDSALTTAATPSPRLLGWLVSGNIAPAVTQDTTPAQHGRVTSAAATPSFRPDHPVSNLSTASTALSTNLTVNGQPAVLLAGPHTLGATAAELPGYILAPLVNINASAGAVPGLGASATPLIGKHAWWIGDEGVKARLNLVDPFAPRPAAPDGSETFFNPTVAQEELRLHAAQRLGVERITDLGDIAQIHAQTAAGSSARGRLARTLSLEQLPLFDSGITAAEASPRFHDLTPHSAGLLADTARGGLRADLTRLLEAPDAPALRAQLETHLARGPLAAGVPLVADLDRDGVFTDPWTNGPTWEQLWSFHHMGRPHDAAPGPVGVMSVGEALPRAHTAAQHGLAPVVVQARIHWGLTVRAAAGQNAVDVLLRPAFVLANPHSVALAATTYAITLDLSAGPRVGWWVDGDATHRWSQEASDLFANLRFELDAPAFEPGEARVFTLKYNQAGWNAAALNYPHSANGAYSLENDWDAGQAHLVIPDTATISDAQLALGLRLALGKDPADAATSGDLALTLWTAAGDHLQRLEHLPFDGQNHNDSGQTPAVTTASARNWHGGLSLRRLAPADAPGLNILQSHNWRAPLLTRDNLGDPAPGYALTPHQRPEWFAGELLLETGTPSPQRVAWGKLSQGTAGFRDNLPGDELFEAVFFDLPAITGPLVSLGQLQHFNAGGHLDGFNHTLGSPPVNTPTSAMRGLAAAPAYAIGHSRASAYLARTATGATAGDRTLRDASWLLNRTLWDRYFFSGLPQTGAFDFAADLAANPRLRPFRDELPSNDIDTYRAAPESAAANLLNLGAFNVNSTSVEAWRALFSSLNQIPYPGTAAGLTGAFARTVRQTAGHAAAPDGISADAWSGYRNLSPAEIDALALAAVDQVRARGPFVSLADFVNRRLANNTTGLQGALDAAIEAAGLNAGVTATPYADRPADTGGIIVDADHREPAQVAGTPGWLKQADLLQALAPGLAARSDTFLIRTYGEVRNPATDDIEGRAWLEAIVQRRPDYVDADHREPAQVAGTPGWLKQADLLQALAPGLAARSDTFLIRTYGEVRNPATDDIEGRAWLEAIVQRRPDYVDAANAPEDRATDLNATNTAFGRKFEIVSFRWLNPDDI